MCARMSASGIMKCATRCATILMRRSTAASTIQEGKGIGPLVGVDASARIAQTPFSVMGGINGAVLWGDVKSVGGPNVASGWVDRTMTNAVAYSGVGWDVLRNVQIAAGYRIESLERNLLYERRI